MTPIAVVSLVGAALVLVAAVVARSRLRAHPASPKGRDIWLLWGATVTLAVAIAAVPIGVLVDWPRPLYAGLALGCVLVPLSLVIGRSTTANPLAERVLVQTLVTSGLVLLVEAVYLLVVFGLGRMPTGHERTTLLLSTVAAALACVFAVPARHRLEEWANQNVYGERHAPDEALRTFGSRMSRAVPLDELLLQLVETLKKTMRLDAAEIWTGTDGHLTRAVSVPSRPSSTLHLNGEELPVTTRAQAQGNAWLQVWMPALLDERDGLLVRSVAVAHLGELLGLIVVERPGDAGSFSEAEDRVLVDLARQVGLALHNVRLDSALQASLEELQQRNAELVASRARIVAAADESRRSIERNLHDGAQQHLVALAVKVGLIKTLLAADPPTATLLIEELRDDVQATLTELRDLAHGIYPPLLRDRGLGEALQTAANRAVLPATVDVDGIGRYDTDVEAAIYFCCLEALQNAGKYAGGGAQVAVAVGNGDGTLWFEVNDDGAGFDPATHIEGHGFINMRDRLGAFGGDLQVHSQPGEGTRIRGTVPLSAI